MSDSRRPPLVLIPQHCGSLVFDRRTSRYMPFDKETTSLFAQLQRQSFANFFATTTADDQSRWADFYDYFYQRGFFTVDGRFAGKILDVSPPSDHLTGPLAVHLEIVGACNLTCSHCFAGELPRNENPLTLVEMDRLFAEFAAMGSFRLGLTGGEPLLRRDLFEIIDCATAHGLHPCLTTNGLLIDEEIAREFGRRDLVWLNVSLDGATARSNDLIRGEGTYDRVLDKLKLLAQHARFTLAFTIMSTNADEVEQCAQLAKEVGAHTAVFRPLYPVGIAQNNLELMPTFGQYSQALVQLESSLTADGDLHAIDLFSPQARQATQAKIYTNNGCGAGNLIASISVQGEVNPCSFLGSGYNAANIRDRSFAEIWHHSQGFQQMRGLSSDSECNSCEDQFQGGCRARSKAFGADINRPDPWHAEYLTENGQRLHPLGNVELSATQQTEVAADV